MKIVYHEPPDAPCKVIEGAEARALVRRALTQMTAGLDELARSMPDHLDLIRHEKRKLRRMAVDAMHRGEKITTVVDHNGYPLGGMIIGKGFEIVGVLTDDKPNLPGFIVRDEADAT